MRPAGSALSLVEAPSREAVRQLGQLGMRLSALLDVAAARAWLSACRRVGARPRTLGRPLVRNGSNVEIGDDVHIDSRAARVELASAGRGRLVVGHDVTIGPGCRLVAARYVEIGDGARLGAGCLVSDDAARGEDGAIWIGDGVTLGDGVRVEPGTVIGAGAVIATGAVVSGTIPPATGAERAAHAPPVRRGAGGG